MQISIAKEITEFKECFNFIKTLWKDEFEIDFNLDLENKYQDFLNSNIYFIREKGIIIAVIQLFKIKKGYKTKDGITPKEDCYFLGRIGISKEYRNMGYGSKLINFGIKEVKKEGIKLIYLSSAINNIDYYSKFGFQKIGNKIKKAGNTSAIHMKIKI